MNRLSVLYFTVIGLLFWGLPSVFIAGPEAIGLTLAAVLPVWLLARYSSRTHEKPSRVSLTTCCLLVSFCLFYLSIDALFGRRLLEWNMFLFGNDAVTMMVEQAKSSISEGRGLPDLVGASLILFPFCLFDASERAPQVGRWMLFVCALAFLFYQTAIGRAFLLMAVFSILLGRKSNKRRMIWAGIISITAFIAASLARGDFDSVAFANPLFDGIAFPFINLSLMLNSNCGSAASSEFVAEFLKKFIPSFILPKTIFSFNLEMSSCIYPFLDNAQESISIFTYLGEFFYYKPSLFTALLSGTIIGMLAYAVDRRLVKLNLPTARVFTGLMCIVLLRSRSQDLMSFLIAQLLFLVFWPALVGIPRTLYRLLRYEKRQFQNAWSNTSSVRLGSPES